MLHVSKGRRIATTMAVQPSNGSLSKIFNYGDTAVTFRTVDGALMVNATQMAKLFGKRATEWLRLPSTEVFMSALINMREQKSEVVKSHYGRRKMLNDRFLRVNNFVYCTKGGRGGGGTYFHEDIAIEFARWLSPAFAVWCNDRIKELFRQSVTQQHPQEQPRPTTPQTLTLDDVLRRLREATDLVTALKQERAERERLEAILSAIRRQIDGQPPKSERLPVLLPELF